jgi:hypothetical protein
VLPARLIFATGWSYRKVADHRTLNPKENPMAIDEPEVTRANMVAAKRDYDCAIKAHRAGKCSAYQMGQARLDWNTAMMCHIEASRVWGPEPEEKV